MKEFLLGLKWICVHIGRDKLFHGCFIIILKLSAVSEVVMSLKSVCVSVCMCL